MKDTPNEIIEDEVFNHKVWLEATTLNMLPGEVVNFTINDKNETAADPVITQATVNKDGKAFVLLEPNNNIEHEKEAVTPIEDSSYFKKGWWSIDEAGEQPITRAVPGMHVYFHIETTISDGEQVHVELYEDDNNEKEETGRGDKDEHQSLVSTVTKKRVTHKIVNNGKIINSIILDNFWGAIDKEVDKQIELYFRCSHHGENVELPHSSSDYLVVGALIVDRYKVPGLNGSGTDIADDLTYGTGTPRRFTDEEGKATTCVIYDKGQVPKYLEEYSNSGFDEEKHALFTNKKDLPSVEPVLKKTKKDEDEVAEASSKRFSVIIEETTRIKTDNTYVDIPKADNYYRQAEYIAKKATRNLKAKYSRDEMYKAKYGIFSTGFDIKVFDNFSDDTLFWDFRETAKLYFARGELQTNLEQMVAKFKSNTGGIYESSILTKHIESHSSTFKYCMYIENYIAQKIKEETLKYVSNIEDESPDFENDIVSRRVKQKIKGDDIIDDKGRTVPLTRPSYSYKNIWDATKGLTIALNDIWATQVVLKELKNKGENYTARYEVTLWDHFGLDLPDMEKIFNVIPSVGETFVSWFVLQHLRGYKPFITKMTFEKEFKGNINEGREARRKKQKAKENEFTPAQKRTWDKATNPLPSGPKW